MRIRAYTNDRQAILAYQLLLKTEEHKLVSGKIPLRIKTDPTVYAANAIDTLNIVIVKTLVEQSLPMRLLNTFQSRLTVTDQLSEIGYLPQMIVKFGQDTINIGLYLLPYSAQARGF